MIIITDGYFAAENLWSLEFMGIMCRMWQKILKYLREDIYRAV